MGINSLISQGSILVVGCPSVLLQVKELLGENIYNLSLEQEIRSVLRSLRDHPHDTDVVVLVPGPSLCEHLELCRAIKFDQRTEQIGVFVWLPIGASDWTPRFFEGGADDCIRGEAPDQERALRLLRVLRSKRALDSLDDADAMIRTLANAVEGKDHYTCGHVERVGDYAVQIGSILGLDSTQLHALRTGGVVHDIGKIGVPEQILNKPGELTREELAIMQRHPLIGYEILRPLRTFRHVLPIVRWHHERPDGSGYPDGLKGEQIPITARIISVADVFDALSTDRSYRKALPLEECVRILRQEASQCHLDASVVEILIRIVESQPQQIQAVA